MPFLDEQTGTLTFSEELSFIAHMPLEALLSLHEQWGGALPKGRDILPFPAKAVDGGSVAPVCILRDGLLHEVRLFAACVGARNHPTAEQQRAFFFQLLSLRDHSPDSRRCSHITYPFGTVLIATDPRTGAALLRVEYKA